MNPGNLKYDEISTLRSKFKRILKFLRIMKCEIRTLGLNLQIYYYKIRFDIGNLKRLIQYHPIHYIITHETNFRKFQHPNRWEKHVE